MYFSNLYTETVLLSALCIGLVFLWLARRVRRGTMDGARFVAIVFGWSRFDPAVIVGVYLFCFPIVVAFDMTFTFMIWDPIMTLFGAIRLFAYVSVWFFFLRVFLTMDRSAFRTSTRATDEKRSWWWNGDR